MRALSANYLVLDIDDLFTFTDSLAHMHKNVYSKTFHTLGALVLTATIGMLNACKSYHLGPPSEIPFKSIYIAPVSNHSYAPQAQTMISAMLRENFIRDARVKVVAEKQTADAVLLVDLTDYERSATARNPQDTAIADSFDLQLVADISLLDPQTEAYFFTNRPVQVTTNAYTGNPYEDNPVIEYQLSERQAMEQLARELARKITNVVLNPW